jgi:hypothetical protein
MAEVEICGATTTIGVDSYDTPAYRTCVLPVHPVTEVHVDHEGFPWVDETHAEKPVGAPEPEVHG